MQNPQERLLGPISFQSFLDRFPAPLNPDLFNEPTGYEKALQEVKQYEDFTTIDWVQDAVRERYRQSTKNQENNNSWQSYLYNSYEAGQAWLVVTLVGIVIGLNAAFIAITTEWLSGFKFGHCSYAWWLNQKFCCWGIDNENGEESGFCDDWHSWSGFGIVDYVFYLVFATTFATTAAFLVRRYSPYAAGSGISEIKCILAGFIMKGYLGGWTLVIKSLGLALSVAANLSVGKEGPSIHIACCAGNIVSRLFPKYQRSRAKSREIISASAAAGVAVAFGAPIGGVLFSFEEMSNHFPAKTMWRSFFCALVATVTLQTMNPYRTGKLVMFQVSYDRDWHFFEVIFFILLGIFGGLYGAFIIKYNLKVQHVRKRYLAQYGVIEAATLAFFTATFAYWNIFTRIDMAESMNILFRECEGSEDYMGLCQPENAAKMIALLFFAMVLRIFTCTITYGAKVPAGIFVPSMAIGALFGRMVGLIVRAAQTGYPGFVLFASCKPDVPCITPGTYAFLGAAAALGGVMRLTVCVVVIMFELTGALNYILPTMITLMVTKAVGDYFGRGGIADRYIRLNGYPFLDKEEHSFGTAVSQVMQKDVTVLPASGTRLDRVEKLLQETSYRGFPIVEDSTSKTLIGYIGRSELKYVIEKAKRTRQVSPMAHCFFRPGGVENRQHMEQSTMAPSVVAAGGGGGSGSVNSGGGGSGLGSGLAATMANMSVSASQVHRWGGVGLGAGMTNSGAGVGSGAGTNRQGDQQPQPHGSPTSHEGETNFVDFGPFIDQTPIAVHPKLPLETVMEFFKKMGPRVILVEHQGKLVGLITIKDLLRHIAKTEALDSEDEEGDEDDRQGGLNYRAGRGNDGGMMGVDESSRRQGYQPQGRDERRRSASQGSMFGFGSAGSDYFSSQWRSSRNSPRTGGGGGGLTTGTESGLMPPNGSSTVNQNSLQSSPRRPSQQKQQYLRQSGKLSPNSQQQQQQQQSLQNGSLHIPISGGRPLLATGQASMASSVATERDRIELLESHGGEDMLGLEEDDEDLQDDDEELVNVNGNILMMNGSGGGIEGDDDDDDDEVDDAGDDLEDDIYGGFGTRPVHHHHPNQRNPLL